MSIGSMMEEQFPVESIRAQVSKILASDKFVRSERLARFLTFTVEQTILGRRDDLKESVIGIEVFDKGGSYDPRIDPIVRVEARRLRNKLRKYYEAEGRGDPFQIEYPVGSYAPVFQKLKAETKRSIAVQPFVNLSSDPENEYFSEGLTEELIHALTKTPGLRVVKGRARDIAAMGAELGVETILEGRVRKSADRLRISVQLIQVRDGSYLWSETYERTMQDVFAIQDEISAAIVAALRLRLGAKPAVKHHTGNLEAYNLYLKGRYHWNKRTEDGLSKGIEFFRQAIELDSQYAPAYFGLADCYLIQAGHGYVTAAQAISKAKAAALNALAIDPSLAEPHATLGAIAAGSEWDWPAAESHFKRAIELNPAYASAHQWYAFQYLAPHGRLDEALAEMDLAQKLDPLSPVIQVDRAEALFWAGQTDLALAEFRRAIDLEPSFARAYLGLGRAYVEKKMYADAISSIETARDMIPHSLVPLALLAHAHGLAGARGRALELLEEFERRNERGGNPYLLGRIYLALDTERALELFERACEERDPRMATLNVSPVFASLRGNPRFGAMLAKMGLD